MHSLPVPPSVASSSAVDRAKVRRVGARGRERRCELVHDSAPRSHAPVQLATRLTQDPDGFTKARGCDASRESPGALGRQVCARSQARKGALTTEGRQPDRPGAPGWQGGTREMPLPAQLLSPQGLDRGTHECTVPVLYTTGGAA